MKIFGIDFSKKKPIVLESADTIFHTPKPVDYTPMPKYVPTNTIGELAIAHAKDLELPDLSLVMRGRNDIKWIAAFKWYNEFVHVGQYGLGMGCRPCWTKVYYALKKAKEKA